MSDEVKSTVAHLSAWIASFIGVISFEMWMALVGLAISAFIALTNHRSRKLQDQLLKEEAKRSVELHDLEMARLRAGIDIPPACNQPLVKEYVAAPNTATAPT